MHCLNVKLKDNIHGQFIKILFIKFMFKFLDDFHGKSWMFSISVLINMVDWILFHILGESLRFGDKF
jgi:hypothetical protein